jgi:hypothetical protein
MTSAPTDDRAMYEIGDYVAISVLLTANWKQSLPHRSHLKSQWPVEPLEEPVEEQLELKTEEEEEMKTSTLEPMEKEPELEIEDEEAGIPGLTWGDINCTNANAKTKLAALTCW